MYIFYIDLDNTLDTIFEESLEYLYQKNHPHTEFNENFILSDTIENSPFQADGLSTYNTSNQIPSTRRTRRSRVS